MANEEGGALAGVEEVLPQFLKLVREKMPCNEKNEPTTYDLPEERKDHIIIDKVPHVLREQNEGAYNPTTISIGPIHRDTKHLHAMEEVKLSYMSALLQPEETMTLCAKAMLESLQEVRKYYRAGSHPKTQNDIWLAEVMLVDGCFVIELLCRNYQNDYDPILWNPFKCHAVQRDLLLLENQIPFFVLQKLFNLTATSRIPGASNDGIQLIDLIFPFFGDMMGVHGYFIWNSFPNEFHHILHLFHSHYVPPSAHQGASKIIYKGQTEMKYPATELRLAGVKLKARRHRRNLFDIRFTTSLFRQRYLEIQSFSVFESTESFLKNLIAFELNCPWIDSYFTSFCFLMDILIDTPEDVKLFEEAGIIRNNLGSREKVDRLFNGICKNAIPRRFHYSKQYKQVMDFCKPWRVSTGRIRNDYFGNPSSFFPSRFCISVIAAIILFALTFLSTLYTMLSYYD